jgi:hypothetical protein
MQQVANRNGASAPPTTGGRMTLKNITRGKQDRPVKAVCYGPGGVGKTTWASRAPKPIYLPTEDGTFQLDVARFPLANHWSDIGEALYTLAHDEHDFKTLVIDTLDGLEPLCWAKVCQANGKNSLSDFDFGKGHVLVTDEWRKMLVKLDGLVRTRKMNIIALAHAKMARVDDPQAGSFDRYSFRLHSRAAELWGEWADAIMFARYETTVVERKGKARAITTGSRVLHTQHSGAFEAKNRFDLPAELPLDWEEFETAMRAHAPAAAAKLRAELLELIPRLEDPEKARKALDEWAGDDPARLAQLLDKVRGKVALSGQAEEPTAGEEGGST